MPLYVSIAGEVVYAGNIRDAWEKLIVIKGHDGYWHRLGHPSKVLVNVGDRVKWGQLIGNVGDHLHYDVMVRGLPVGKPITWYPHLNRVEIVKHWLDPLGL